MPHSHGLRRRTRYIFQRPFRSRGPLHLSTYLTTYKIGDYVDIIGNGSIHRGMPHKFYHGRTGQIWNVTPHAVGVEVNKRVRQRIIVKRIHVRIEHVRPSRCQEDFLRRKREIPVQRHDAKKAGSTNLASFFFPSKAKFFLFFTTKTTEPLPPLKRLPAQPKPGRFVKTTKTNQAQTITPVKYEDLF